MLNAQRVFVRSINSSRDLSSLHDYLTRSLVVPYSFDDIIRSQLVYALSAFDKLIHDLIRIGLVDMFKGNRPLTPKYLSEPISIDLYQRLVIASIPPADYIFQQEMIRKLKAITFQDPKKVAEGLPYIWNKPHKWQNISASMTSPGDASLTLKLITNRRNAIVHEFDADVLSNERNTIEKYEVDNVCSFLEDCGNTIVRLVK